jgi:uncharacterized protein YdhG (YjbR/CyaY superfamily)
MVQSKAQSVDDYIAEAAPDRAGPLRMIRDIALRELAGYEERMQWGMPAYFRGGDQPAFAFASQKQYIALYVSASVSRESHAEALKGADCGKSCIRFRKPADIAPSLVEALLRDTAAARTAVC